jgi:hypothetical protein
LLMSLSMKRSKQLPVEVVEIIPPRLDYCDPPQLLLTAISGGSSLHSGSASPCVQRTDQHDHHNRHCSPVCSCISLQTSPVEFVEFHSSTTDYHHPPRLIVASPPPRCLNQYAECNLIYSNWLRLPSACIYVTTSSNVRHPSQYTLSCQL